MMDAQWIAARRAEFPFYADPSQPPPAYLDKAATTLRPRVVAGVQPYLEALGHESLCRASLQVYNDEAAAAFSVATELLTGAAFRVWQAQAEAIPRWLTGQTPFHPQWPEALRAFEAVRQFPARVYCAARPWQALLNPQPSRSEAPS